jgi:hypothetical protein
VAGGLLKANACDIPKLARSPKYFSREHPEVNRSSLESQIQIVSKLDLTFKLSFTNQSPVDHDDGLSRHSTDPCVCNGINSNTGPLSKTLLSLHFRQYPPLVMNFWLLNS